MTNYLWHNGDWAQEHTPLFQAQDRLRLGDGVFDTLLIVDGKPLHHARHFERLAHDSSVMGLSLPLSEDYHLNLIDKLLDKNNITTGQYALNTLISRGVQQRGLMPAEDTNSSATMMLSPVPDSFPHSHGIICTSTCRNEHSPLSHIKSCNYGDNVLALLESRKKGANEALITNTVGHIACASSGNVFIAVNDEIITPPLSEGAMNGVTRALLLEALPIRETAITLDMLHQAHGIYVTNSVKGIVRLSQLEETYYDIHTPVCALDLPKETDRIIRLT